MDPTQTGPDTDKVRAHCRRRAKFHYMDTDLTRTKSVHVVGYELNSTTRTRTDFFCGETPLGPCGSGRVRVVEFSSYPTTCADFVRVGFVSVSV